MKETAVGVGYYKREQWNFLLESASDRENLEGTYEEWLQVFKETIGKLKAQGIKPYKIDVDVRELIAFCEEKGFPNNGKTRAQFISHLVSKHRGIEL